MARLTTRPITTTRTGAIITGAIITDTRRGACEPGRACPDNKGREELEVEANSSPLLLGRRSRYKDNARGFRPPCLDRRVNHNHARPGWLRGREEPDNPRSSS